MNELKTANEAAKILGISVRKFNLVKCELHYEGKKVWGTAKPGTEKNRVPVMLYDMDKIALIGVASLTRDGNGKVIS